jgi:hypothetical protein
MGDELHGLTSNGPGNGPIHFSMAGSPSSRWRFSVFGVFNTIFTELCIIAVKNLHDMSEIGWLAGRSTA